MALKLLSSALFAGIAAGLIAVLLQFWLVTPLLLEGEEYETGTKVHFAGVIADQDAGHDHSAHSHDNEISGSATDGADNITRHAMTLAVNIIVFSGFGLIMVAGFALAENYDHRLSFHTGLIWGMAGFIAIQLAPGAGLFPELPGTPAADIAARQWWWLGTVIATGAGIALIAFGRGLPYIVIGAVAIAVPHIIGAPHLPDYSGVAPPELSALFVTRTLFVAMIGWVTLGGVAGYFWGRETDTQPA